MARYAAVDIGSNSVRMAVGEVSLKDGIKILAAERQVTRLGSSVFAGGKISKDAMTQVLGALRHFATIYTPMHVAAVRAVATSAVRDAGNQQEFLTRASKALGAPVEIISGLEEARLIHSGVVTRWPRPELRRLMIDIGGGSAEIIDSQRGRLVSAVSKPLGAVRLTEMFLKHDPPLPQELERLDSFINEKLRTVLRGPLPVFDEAVGTSATAAAVVCAILRVGRLEREAADKMTVSTKEIGALYRKLSRMNLARRRKSPGIGPRRAEIILAGAAVLYKILTSFNVDLVHYSTAGVRDGILADLSQRRAGAELSRLTTEQQRGVEALAKRFGVDVAHARKVADLSHALFSGLRPLHQLPASAGKLLEAAAYLVDTGHYISGIGHHKHSHYVVANADLAGFTNEERQTVALLCRFHRKSIPETRHDFFVSQTESVRELVWRLTPILRLADGLEESQLQRVADVDCHVTNTKVTVSLLSNENTNLEQWAGERAGAVFESIYGRKLMVEHVAARTTQR